MLGGLFLLGAIGTAVTLASGIKEASTPNIPAENWENQELIQEDRMNGVPEKEILKNVANGKYKVYEKYPEPHRAEDGRIIIENCLLYESDLKRYDPLKVDRWVEQGKYNLTPEELEKERERIKKEWGWD